MELVFLLEEPSAKIVLDNLLPRILPEGVTFRTIPHRGKSDLQKSIPVKLRAWRTPGARFVIVHDQDSNDCVALKQELLSLCQHSGHDDVLVRIICRELEAWYFGDPEAVELAYPNSGFVAKTRKRSFRASDEIVKPSEQLERLIPAFQKGGGATAISPHLSLERNQSRSFQVFVEGIRRLCEKT